MSLTCEGGAITPVRTHDAIDQYIQQNLELWERLNLDRLRMSPARRQMWDKVWVGVKAQLAVEETRQALQQKWDNRADAWYYAWVPDFVWRDLRSHYISGHPASRILKQRWNAIVNAFTFTIRYEPRTGS